ncbi:MAG: hypothetical protein ACU0CO_18845 [Shimia sp.]
MALSSKRPSRRDETRSKLMRDVTETIERKRRLNAEIEDGLYRRIKARAAEDGRTISDITRELWIEYLSR